MRKFAHALAKIVVVLAAIAAVATMVWVAAHIMPSE